jgi:phage baseplate assembly protein gpV
MNPRAPSDADRRIAGLVELGSVTASDAAHNSCDVDLGGLLLSGVAVSQLRSGLVKVQWVPSVGEQVLVASPGGDLSRAIIVGSVPTSLAMVAADLLHPTMDLGGATLVVRNGQIEITGPVLVTGNVTVTGDVSVTGKVTASVDVVGSGKSLKDHRHTGVAAGSAVTGAPQ